MTAVPSTSEQSDVVILNEVPPSLDRALMLMVKNFFTREQYIITYYVMRAVCIKEDQLRNKLHLDQKQLRQALAGLKAEKLIKERLHQQKNELGRSVTIIFYFINYRAILNVLKYKIDHMRQKLESKEREGVQKANYRCSQCNAQYDMLEIDRICDPFTGALKCWRCSGEVTQDHIAGPENNARSQLAKFNEQLLPLFACIRELSGVQLAPHLLEPDTTQFLAEDDNKETTQLLDFSSAAVRRELGGAAFSAQAGGINYSHADNITVDLNADTTKVEVQEAKAVPLWLQDTAIGNNTEQAQAAAALEDSHRSPVPKQPAASAMSLLVELEGQEEPKEEEPSQNNQADGQINGATIEKVNDEDAEDEEDEDEEEEEECVEVQGKKIPWSEVTPDEVERMTEEEKQAYTAVVQQHMEY